MEERQKDAEQNVYLDGIECLITKICGQNTSNMNLYNENMMTIVQSLKDSLTKTEVNAEDTTSATSTVLKMAKLLYRLMNDTANEVFELTQSAAYDIKKI